MRYNVPEEGREVVELPVTESYRTINVKAFDLLDLALGLGSRSFVGLGSRCRSFSTMMTAIGGHSCPVHAAGHLFVSYLQN
jgi:hypothetical protein